jgi:penicillin amidase
VRRITRRWRTWKLGTRTVRIARDRDGVPHVRGDEPLDRIAGLGLVHAIDRPMQLTLLRLAVHGRLAELLVDDESSFAIDRFMRVRGFSARARRNAATLSPEAAAIAEAYCEGVRAGLRRPWELSVAGLPADFMGWDPVDVLAAMEVTSYVGLASLQEDLQRVLIDGIRRGASPQNLRSWWFPHLESIDADLVERLRALNHWEGALQRVVRQRVERVAPAIARASNAWAVSGARTRSGKPMIAFDPHLEANRLPAIFSEVVLEGDDGPTVGITVPGVPGVVMGRNPSLAFGFTYGFLDQIDFFVEEVRGGRCRRADDGAAACVVRNELIRRKHGRDVLLHVRENELGVLEDGEQPRDGRFLCRAWAGARADWGEGLCVLDRLGRMRTVVQARDAVRAMPLSGNWVFADRDGDVGWSTSGAAPVRPDGGAGLAPARGWDPGRVWAPGLRAPGEMPSGGPDASGCVASANDPRPRSVGAGAVLVDASMGSDRVDRILSLLAERRHHDVQTFAAMQRDVVSDRGRRWRDRLRFAGLLANVEDGGPAATVARWDGRETSGNEAAERMEAFWQEMMREVYGKGVFGETAFELLAHRTSVLGMYAAAFDDGAIRHGAAWTARRDLDELCRDVWSRIAGERSGRRRRVSRIVFRHLLFGGRMPGWAGFDKGPFSIHGGRSTLHQVQRVPGRGHESIVAPVYRFVCDLGEEGAWTALAGGPRDRWGSRYYASGLLGWLEGRLTPRGSILRGRRAAVAPAGGIAAEPALGVDTSGVHAPRRRGALDVSGPMDVEAGAER